MDAVAIAFAAYSAVAFATAVSVIPNWALPVSQIARLTSAAAHRIISAVALKKICYRKPGREGRGCWWGQAADSVQR